MDMSGFRRGELRALGRRAAQLDYRVLVATLQATQLATPTARAESRCNGGGQEAERSQPAPLPAILLGAQNWQQAVLAQGGSFNTAFARGFEGA